MRKMRPPNEKERVVYFNYLKRASSLAAWNRVFDLYTDVVRTFEKLYAHPSNQGLGSSKPYLADSDLGNHQLAHRAFEEAIERLKNADRSCFRWSCAPGHFSEGMCMMQVIHVLSDRMFQGESTPPFMNSPMWPELASCLLECSAAYNFCGVVLEERWADVPAPLRGPHGTGPRGDGPESLGGSADYINEFCADLSGPPVFDSDDPVIVVKTGETVPVTGIWEPCVPRDPDTGFFSLFRRRRFVFGDLITNHEGCMNYLHQGAAARTISFVGDSYRREGKPTSWYLLWEDNRYGANPVPEEESRYTYPPSDRLDYPAAFFKRASRESSS